MTKKTFTALYFCESLFVWIYESLKRPFELTILGEKFNENNTSSPKKILSTGAYEIVSRPLTIVLDYMNWIIISLK